MDKRSAKPIETNLDQKQLRHFLAVAKYGQFQRAAEDFGISKQGISKSIAALEVQLNVTLFDRKSYGVECTEFGQALIRHAKVILSEVENARRELSHLKASTAGEITVAFGASFSQTIGLNVLRGFRAKFPNVVVRVESTPPDVAVAKLADGAIDLVASSLNPTVEVPASIQSELLFSVPYNAFCGASNPLASGKGKLRLADLEEQQWVTLWRSDRTRQHIVDVFRKHDVRPPENFLFSNDLNLSRDLVIQDGYLMFSTASTFAIELEIGLVKALNVPELEASFDATLLYRDVSLSRTIVQAMKDEIVAVSKQFKPISRSSKSKVALA